MKPPPFSFHCFLFPFKWEHLFYDAKPFEQRTNLDEFERKLGLLPANDDQVAGKWLRKPFQIEGSELSYNEYNYFYDFVRDVIYDSGDQPDLDRAHDGKSLVRHYEYCLKDEKAIVPTGDSYYEITCNTGRNDEQDYRDTKYRLTIKKIFLDIYETGVGILSYHLLNYKYSSPQDILNINQFGRRAFVGGFKLTGYPSKKISTEGREKFVDLAKSITLRFASGTIIQEDFSGSKDSYSFKDTAFILPSFITELLGGKDNSYKLTTNWYPDVNRENYIWISPSIDDRMFVASWYCCEIPKYTDYLQLVRDSNQPDNYYKEFIENSNFWYKYIFTDKHFGESHQNPHLQKEQSIQATYDRWLNYGTLYGISRYSFVMFCNYYTPDFLLAIFETMYLKMVELSLVQRASVLRFSDEVQYVSSMKKDSEKTEQIRGLYKYHIRFVNKIYFQEITAQEQGIELYDRMQEAMRVNSQVEYLDKEISQLHDYGLLLEEKKRSEKLDLIAYVGFPIAIITLILSVFGFVKDIVVDPKEIEKPLKYIGLYFYPKVWKVEIFGMLLMGISGYFILLPHGKLDKSNIWLKILLFVLFSVGLIITIIYPFYNYIRL